MKESMTMGLDVFLPDEGMGRVNWSEPKDLGKEAFGTWHTELSVDMYPNGRTAVAFYGTEAQIKAVRGTCS